jgi:hypothetical protein
MNVENIMSGMKRFAFPVAASTLFIGTFDGFLALLQAKGFDPLTWILAFMIAALIDFLLVSAVIDWKKAGSIGALLTLIVLVPVSGALSTNLYYRLARGDAKTTETFNVQRAPVVDELVELQDRTAAVVNGLASLRQLSDQLADREVKEGNTCGLFAKTTGPRQRFRRQDQTFFHGLENALAAIPPRITTQIDAVRALKALPGASLEDDLSKLRLAVSNAGSIVRDPALDQVRQALRKRIEDDAKDRFEGQVKFNCADNAIVTQAETVLARLNNLPKFAMKIEVPDYTKASEGLRIFSLLANWRDWGKPGGLTGIDFGVMLIMLVVEFGLIASAGSYVRNLRSERPLDFFPDNFDMRPEKVMALIRAITEEPDARVRQFCHLLQRYKARIGFHDRIFVAYGTNDPAAMFLEWVMPTLVAAGLAKRDRWVLQTAVSAVGAIRWPETRGCYRRETFRVAPQVLDEIHLAELVYRMQAKPTPPATTTLQ